MQVSRVCPGCGTRKEIAQETFFRLKTPQQAAGNAPALHVQGPVSPPDPGLPPFDESLRPDQSSV